MIVFVLIGFIGVYLFIMTVFGHKIIDPGNEDYAYLIY